VHADNQLHSSYLSRYYHSSTPDIYTHSSTRWQALHSRDKVSRSMRRTDQT